MSVAMWNCHYWPLDNSSSVKLPFGHLLWGSLAKVGLSAKLCVPGNSRHLCLITGRGPSAKVCSSAKCCVLAFKASMLYLGGPSAKVGPSANFGVAVFKASMLNWHWDGGSIGQSRFICQVWCSSVQGIYAQFTGRDGGPLLPKEVHLPSLV